MRAFLGALAVSGALTSPAYAGDKPLIAPAPAWVRPVSLPSTSPKPDEAPVQLLLSDQQVDLQPGRQTVYSQMALKIQTPQGLAVGNISFPWRPDTEELTVHRLVIRRGDQAIDVLASGQTFTVIRREQNLESATLDGVLTANIQPEGLQVGDVLEFAISVSSSDPVLKGHVEQIGANWDDTAIGRAHLRMQWPNGMKARLRQTPSLPAFKPVRVGDSTSVEILLDDVKPIIPPKGAPARYRIGRLAEMTDFASWADLGALMAPLYEKAATLPAQGPLHAELERIRNGSRDPKAQAEAALALVQDRIRYVALAMGAGGLVPADAEATWSRRYGDCKGKTALLLALLHAMDIQAEPVAVSTVFGDGMDARLPMIGLFNHVLVRATISGKTYWLDGTRSGDTSLDRLAIPAFGWGLPLVPAGAALVRMVPTPLEVPTRDVSIRIDATAGLTIPAPFKVETIVRGDGAVAMNASLANLVGDARTSMLRDYWKEQYDFVDMKSAASTFDPKSGELRLSMEGLAKMDWSSGWYETDGTGVGYKADFTRAATQDQNAPFAVPYPYYQRSTETILLPPSFAGVTAGLKSDVNQTVAGIEYHRQSKVEAAIFSIEVTERSVAPEFPAKDAAAAQAKLRELANQTTYLRKPPGYKPTEKEADLLIAATPTTAREYLDRGILLLDRNRQDEAIKDFDQASTLDPKNAWALANRGIARIWKGELDLAAKDLDAAAAIDPNNGGAWRGRGMIAQRKGPPQDAVAAYTKSLGIDPGNAFDLGHRAEANKAAGNDEAALRDAAAALKIDPKWIDLYLLRANILRNQGKNEDALKEAVAVEAANPDIAFAHVTAANLFAAFHQDAEAMKAYDRAIAIKPEAYIYLNRSMRRPKADIAGRQADLDAAARLDPNDEDVLTAKAELQVDKGDFAGAIVAYTSAIDKSPGNAELLTDRGIAYARSGDAKRAAADFTNARAKATEAVDFNNMCWSKAKAGIELEAALADCNTALNKAPGTAAYLDSRGLALLRLGRLDDAIADYDKALAKYPHMAFSLFGRGVAWARKGDKDKSAADMAAALKVAPEIRTDFERFGITS
jgi:tetratricopeptide (TPR) repeat protein